MEIFTKLRKHTGETVSTLVLTVILAACGNADSQGNVTISRSDYSTLAAAATTLAHESPTSTPGTPEVNPECKRDPQPNLVVGGQGQSSPDGSALNLRSQPDKTSDAVGKLANNEVFKVLDGPICDKDGKWYWFKIQLSDGTVGWVANGDPSGYYESPYQPATATADASSSF
jgi:uncharacterized protein YgiM (DUF1202 family)